MQICVIQKPHHLVTNSHPQHTYIYTWRKEKKGKNNKTKHTNLQTANHKKRRIEKKKKKKVQSSVVGITNKLNNGV
jgi:hypothetical protein